jgi:uncharacterized protein (TIGR03643 family)
MQSQVLNQKNYEMKNFSVEDISRIVEMAWEDKTPFEAIEIQLGLKENEVREIMRREMKSSSFKMWRERVSGRKTKHLFMRSREVNRFKSKNQ